MLYYIMSLINIFCNNNEEVIKLKEQLKIIKKENEIFLEEIRMLKKLLYGITIEKKCLLLLQDRNVRVKPLF